MKVQDIGEQGLLKIVQQFCPPEIIGDDGAVLVTEAEKSLVVTTDVLVDNIHFSENTTSPEDVGWRSVAANLSDLAAMGATPLGITVGLGLPGHTQVEWVEKLYQGMSQCLKKYNGRIVGGDIVRSPTTTISITAFGQVYPYQTIYRHTAKVGDAIVVTGIHGASRAGLELLLHPESYGDLSQRHQQKLIQAHQRPQPRLDVLPILWDIISPESDIRISGMDSSDGLADAVVQICRASQVGATLEWQNIPTSEILSTYLKCNQILEYTLYGGEDFQLILCLPKKFAEILVHRLGQNAAIIGNITSGLDVTLQDQAKKIPDQVLTLNQGFQHF
ncbi:thiamine-phosphate kinase [Calothrix sp. PCC 6303]|uniref:thiamine-phosphate kinase n=1 Tax=Calothrix sp. PCC 6303 TaxID=1170562 RepID=UPI0002A00FF4|nr:thiamine-phosphate kinase [Calothrix sp. PCC 6303]AFZ02933.1 thiamine-phosphate kinase [Calothrix sp. PCC 6303]